MGRPSPSLPRALPNAIAHRATTATQRMAVTSTRVAFGAFMGDGLSRFWSPRSEVALPKTLCPPIRTGQSCRARAGKHGIHRPMANSDPHWECDKGGEKGPRLGLFRRFYARATPEKRGFRDFPCGQWPILGPLSHHQMRPRRVFGHPLIDWRRPASCGHPTDHGCPKTANRPLTTLVAIRAESATVLRETPVAA